MDWFAILAIGGTLVVAGILWIVSRAIDFFLTTILTTKALEGMN